MPEDDKDVKLASSTNEETTVNATEEVAESASVEQTEANLTETATNVASEEVDERGVPWKNKALEYERKLRETSDRLPQVIQEEIRKANEQVKSPKYTVQELEQFAIENPQHRPWVEAEKMKLLEERLESSQNQRIERERQAIQAQAVRKEAEAWVTQAYPEMFVKDSYGRLNWKNDHPMTGLVSQYMADPRIQSQPDALRIAAKLAYADMAVSKVNSSQSQVKKLKTEVKKIQQKTLTEGNTRPASASTDSKKASLEQLARTGSEKDARTAVRDILKQAGMIKD